MTCGSTGGAGAACTGVGTGCGRGVVALAHQTAPPKTAALLGRSNSAAPQRAARPVGAKFRTGSVIRAAAVVVTRTFVLAVVVAVAATSGGAGGPGRRVHRGRVV